MSATPKPPPDDAPRASNDCPRHGGMLHKPLACDACWPAAPAPEAPPPAEVLKAAVEEALVDLAATKPCPVRDNLGFGPPCLAPEGHKDDHVWDPEWTPADDFAVPPKDRRVRAAGSEAPPPLPPVLPLSDAESLAVDFGMAPVACAQMVVAEVARLRSALSSAREEGRREGIEEADKAEARAERDALLEAARAAIPADEYPKDKTADNWAWQIRNLGDDRRFCYRHLAAAERERDEARAEVERLRQAHWDGRAIGGFDNDGDPTPRAVASDFAALILSDWRDERESLDEARAETDAAESREADLRAALAAALAKIDAEVTECGTEDCERCEWLRKATEPLRALAESPEHDGKEGP